jgi:hypothetical protein
MIDASSYHHFEAGQKKKQMSSSPKSRLWPSTVVTPVINHGDVHRSQHKRMCRHWYAYVAEGRFVCWGHFSSSHHSLKHVFCNSKACQIQHISIALLVLIVTFSWNNTNPDLLGWRNRAIWCSNPPDSRLTEEEKKEPLYSVFPFNHGPFTNSDQGIQKMLVQRLIKLERVHSVLRGYNDR